MGLIVRHGRGKAKPSQLVKNSDDAKALTQAVTRRQSTVQLSTGTYILKTTKPSEPVPNH
jgi:hypothetical protein